MSYFASCHCDKTQTKSNSGKTYGSQAIMEGSPSKNLEAWTEEETTEEHCLLACFGDSCSPAILALPRPTAQGGIAHSEVSHPTLIIH